MQKKYLTDLTSWSKLALHEDSILNGLFPNKTGFKFEGTT
jgi:hypothetical protein